MNLNIKLKSVNDVALFVKTCEKFDEDIDYKQGRYVIDAKSIMGVLSTDVGNIALVKIITDKKEIKEKFEDAIKLWKVS